MTAGTTEPGTLFATFESGPTRLLRASASSADAPKVVGLDAEGRIAVDYEFDYYFALTLCCDAGDKGSMGEVVCRACYGTAPNADTGAYLFGRDAEIADRLATIQPAP